MSELVRRFFGAIPRYRFRSVLGSGASGVVFEAWDELLETEIAIKVLRRLEAVERPTEDEDRLARLKKELRLNRRLRHPGIARLYDFGCGDGLPFVTMELIRGRDLREVMEVEKVETPRALRILHGLAEACAAAHASGVVHRDLKPENVMIVDGDRPILLDLGLGYDLWSPSETPIGTIVGTPVYMSPEQLQGFTPDARSDVYAMGVIAFELLTGEPPIRARGNLVEMALARLRTPPDPEPLRASGVPEAVVTLVMRALERMPEERFSHAGELAAELSRWASVPVPLAEATEAPAPRVLTVDDDPVIRALLRMLLEPAGYEVVESGSGEDAIRKLSASHVDLVLLDIVMPVMDGFDVLQVVRTTPAISRTPVVLVSARADRGRRALATQNGANGFLEKPIDPQRVLQVTRSFLG